MKLVWKTPEVAPINPFAFGASPVAVTSPIYSRKAGCPSVVPIIEDGYPKATWPREILKQTQKFLHFILGLDLVMVVSDIVSD